MVIYEDSKKNRFEFFEKENILVATVTEINGENLKTAFNQFLEVFEKHKCTRWFSDNRNFVLMANEDVAWFAQDWFPRSIKKGLKYWAIVEKPNTPELSLNSFIRTLKSGGVDARIFHKVEEAKNWMLVKK